MSNNNSSKASISDMVMRNFGAIVVIGMIVSIGIGVYYSIDWNQLNKLHQKVDNMNCRQLALYIRDNTFASWVSGYEGDKFSKECMQPIFHQDYVSQSEADQYISQASCPKVLEYAQSYFLYYEDAQKEYEWRCTK